MIEVQRPAYAEGWLLNWRLMLATTRTRTLAYASNTIQLIRSPLYPISALIGFKLVYDISGQTTVSQSEVLGFLVTGLIAIGAWQATVWGAGAALQMEMWSGTIGSVMMAPGSPTAVILGYTLANFLFFLPAVASTLIVGQLMGAEWNFAHPLAIGVSLTAVYLSCVCVGMAFGGLFIMSRQANALSNFLQEPIHLLGGFYVSREVLPDWLQTFSNILPLAHALDALRDSALQGSSMRDIAEPMLWCLGTSLVFVLIGIWSLARLDRVVRHAGTLDLL